MFIHKFIDELGIFYYLFILFCSPVIFSIPIIGPMIIITTIFEFVLQLEFMI